MPKVRVGIIDVGNCAALLVQGVRCYRDAPEDELVPGLMHVNLGGYHILDIEFVAAFGVSTKKVGGALDGPSAYFTRSTPVQCPDARAREMVETYIEGAGTPARVPTTVTS